MAEENKEPIEEKNKELVDPIEEEYLNKIIKGFDKDKEQESLIPKPPPIEKDTVKEKVHSLPDEYNVKHIGDLNYLQEIFSNKYDKYHSLNYLQKTRKILLDEGYMDNAQLNEYLFWSTMSRKLQIIYQRTHAKVSRIKGSNEDDAEDLSLLKEMRAVSEQVASLQRSIDGVLDKRKKVKDVVDLHAETMDEAEQFIKSHIGEFQFKCKKCNSIVNTEGLPYFAIMTEKDSNNEIVYHIFSPELWFLHKKKGIPLHYIAFALRTSPEGILLTAEQREERGAKADRENAVMLEEEENNLKQLVQEYHERTISE